MQCITHSSGHSSLHCLFRRLRSDFIFPEIDTKNSHGDLSKERDAIPDQSRGIKLIQLKGWYYAISFVNNPGLPINHNNHIK